MPGGLVIGIRLTQQATKTCESAIGLGGRRPS